jgi:hypothetical protein
MSVVIGFKVPGSRSTAYTNDPAQAKVYMSQNQSSRGLRFSYISPIKMHGIVQVALSLLLFFHLSFEIHTDDETGYCKYYNDPHLIPFPTSPGDIQDQYICRDNCTKILVEVNDYNLLFLNIFFLSVS